MDIQLNIAEGFFFLNTNILTQIDVIRHDIINYDG